MNNKLIEKLAVQSLVYVDTGLDDGKELIFSKEKFAELIVRECIKDCRDMFVVDSVSWNLLNEKLEHFGVEE
jgi:hypothetical protein